MVQARRLLLLVALLAGAWGCSGDDDDGGQVSVTIDAGQAPSDASTDTGAGSPTDGGGDAGDGAPDHTPGDAGDGAANGGEDACERANLNCDPATECAGETTAPACGPCPEPYVGDGIDGCHPADPARTLVLGAQHGCALLESGAIKCWGANDHGQLGLGDTENRGDDADELAENLPVVALGDTRTAASVVLGDAHGCALFTDQTVKCWGSNARGQLGLGDTNDRGAGPDEMGDHLPVVDLGAGQLVVALALGANHSCALLDSGTIKCWGANTYGQLGLGDTNDRGDVDAEMGDNLPVVDLGSVPISQASDRPLLAVAVAAGGNHTCALLEDGQVKCWGQNEAGQLGVGDILDRGGGPSTTGDNLPVVDLGAGRVARSLALGGDHTCAVLDQGSVKCWGANESGQLGQGDREDLGDDLEELGANLNPVQLGPGRTAISVTAGLTHTCASLDGGLLKCWGASDQGQLGQGDVETRGDEPGEMGDALLAIDLGERRSVVAVAAGAASTCAMLSNGAIKCWGSGAAGVLGHGDEQSWGDGPDEMGAQLPILDLGP